MDIEVNTVVDVVRDLMGGVMEGLVDVHVVLVGIKYFLCGVFGFFPMNLLLNDSIAGKKTMILYVNKHPIRTAQVMCNWSIRKGLPKMLTFTQKGEK